MTVIEAASSEWIRLQTSLPMRRPVLALSALFLGSASLAQPYVYSQQPYAACLLDYCVCIGQAGGKSNPVAEPADDEDRYWPAGHEQRAKWRASPQNHARQN